MRIQERIDTWCFVQPYGIAIDSSDRVYISEYYPRVSVLDSEGRHLTTIGSWGSGPGQFKAPRGVAVDRRGVVYVCETNAETVSNGRIQLF